MCGAVSSCCSKLRRSFISFQLRRFVSVRPQPILTGNEYGNFDIAEFIFILLQIRRADLWVDRASSPLCENRFFPLGYKVKLALNLYRKNEVLPRTLFPL